MVEKNACQNKLTTSKIKKVKPGPLAQNAVALPLAPSPLPPRERYRKKEKRKKPSSNKPINQVT